MTLGISFAFSIIAMMLSSIFHLRWKKTSRHHDMNFACFITLLMLVIFMGGNVVNPDNNIYKIIYYQLDFFSKDVGFGILVFIAKKIGISLLQFRLIISIFGFLIIDLITRKYISPDYRCAFYWIYFIFPFFYDLIQIRNFLGLVFFIVSIYWISKDEIKGDVLFLIFIALAALMQKTFLFYMPFIIIGKLLKKRMFKQLIAALGVFFIALSANKKIVSTIANFALSTVADSLSGVSKFLGVSSGHGWMVLWFWTFVNLYMSYAIYIQMMSYRDKNYLLYSNEKIGFSKTIYWLNLYCIIALPFYIMNFNFFRIERNLQVINLIDAFMLFDIQYRNKKYVSKNKKYWLIRSSVIIITILGIWLYQSVDNLFASTVSPAFTSNWILKY